MSQNSKQKISMKLGLDQKLIFSIYVCVCVCVCVYVCVCVCVVF